MKERQLGFVGVGQMAQPMVKHLLDDGYEVLIHNRRRDPLKGLMSKGAIYCEQPEDTVVEGGILFNCLPDDNALLSLFHAHSSIFQKLGEEGLHVSIATISPQASKKLHERHKKLGGNYCVATVMGRPDAVENKKQFYILAGESHQLERVRPILESIGSATFTIGEQPELANVAKLSFNFLIASAIESMAEAFTFARKNGVDISQFFSLISETLFSCPLYKNYGKAIIDRRFYEPLFRMALGAKDVNLVSSAAKESQTPMRIASVLQDRFTASLAKGRADYDWLGIALDVEEDAGIKSDT
jgi:3-hydroxyisobutyrate dehydrogenase-like beta-hydroxyacid dehydrogenase